MILPKILFFWNIKTNLELRNHVSFRLESSRSLCFFILRIVLRCFKFPLLVQIHLWIKNINFSYFALFRGLFTLPSKSDTGLLKFYMFVMFKILPLHLYVPYKSSIINVGRSCFIFLLLYKKLNSIWHTGITFLFLLV